MSEASFEQPIAIVTAGGMNPQIMINALAARFPNVTVIEEQPEPKSVLLKRRAKKLGWINAGGQLATMIVSRLGKKFAAARQTEILKEFAVSAEQNPHVPVIHVASVNTPDFLDAVRTVSPAVIFTVSCRILSARTLAALPCPVINFHAGINPAYRGQMGGYWSLVSGDANNFGATVHLVDAGIDTGETLYEKRVTPSKSDTMLTYPLLLTASCTDIAIKAVEDVLASRAATYKPSGPSKMYYNPPIWTWLWNGVSKGIW
ncbi:formyl transferase [Rhizobium sp. NRK18]|uniref:formyl transferase n=1 Tax=Rhizobium sp. NRK18 TaxID=2964667 RepID=UPI0021C36BEA|nr:formyl transferase [Rhizobium sp. NRK18]MCQ2003858.1 formyl transferase [Rhizobium sp. NRK18]